MRTPRRDQRGEDGAILVVALIIITVVAVVTGAVLTRGDGSLRASVALRDVASSSAAADAAAQVAINDLRTGYNVGSTEPAGWAFDNDYGDSCFGATDTLALDNLIPKTAGTTQAPVSASVVCTPENATGSQGSAVPINNSNKPGYAIVTLGGPLTTSDPLKVHGGVYSNSTINGQVALDVGDAYASGACAQTTVTAPGTKHCSTGSSIADPGYSNDLGGTIPALQVPPTSCTSGVAVFQPGYYDSAAKLNAATGLCSVAWFKPGTYYFDFHNDSCTNVCPSNLYGTGGNTWTINGATVVAGTPTNASGTVISMPPASPVMPGSCQSPITDPTAVGVQFVFGGNSQIYIDQNSHVELCGSYHANRPPIELYGLKSGSTPTVTNATGLNVAAVPTPGGFTAAPPATGLPNALAAAADGRVATWTTANNNSNQTTTITTTGFAPGASVPAGSVLTAATLHVRHQDVDATANSAGTAKLTIGSATTSALPVPQSATMTTTDIALSGANLNALQTAVHDNGFSAATVAYTANAKKAASVASLDLISLDLTYYVPVLRGQGGTCIDGSSGSCTFISMKNGNNKILFYLQGTTYIPYADANILLGNFSAEVAKFGIVARQLEFGITNGNPSYTGPIFEIPDNSPGFGFSSTFVQLTVYVCPGVTSGCTPAQANNKPALKARVQAWDPTGSPVAKQRQMTILSWSHTR